MGGNLNTQNYRTSPKKWLLDGGHADAAGDLTASSLILDDWMLSLQEFTNAAKGASRSAGLDGWHTEELKMLVQSFPWRQRTSLMFVKTSTNEELRRLLFSWRVVGIPKKDPRQSRPTGVASCFLRAWLSACEASMTVPQEEQFACRAGQCGCERETRANVTTAPALCRTFFRSVCWSSTASGCHTAGGMDKFKSVSSLGTSRESRDMATSRIPKGALQCLGPLVYRRSTLLIHGRQVDGVPITRNAST